MSSVHAVPRTALIIGNSQYQKAPLSNPEHDAQDMAEKLRHLNFEVIQKINVTRRQMKHAIREFERKLRKKGGVGLFYYAGHGVQINGTNYLVPLNAEMRYEFEVPDEALDANSVLRAMESADNDMNIVILDACRDNPFARSWRSSSRGLARMYAPTGSLVAYATAPGMTAADGDQRNGTYTRYLLKYIGEPQLSLTQIFMRVRTDVEKETGGRQTPWEESSLRDDFYFIEDPQPQAVTSSAPSSSFSNKHAEITFWNSIRDKRRAAYFTAYLKRYGDEGIYSEIAKLSLNELQTERVEKTRTTGLPRLTVRTSPEDAKVRILNIIPAYEEGIVLAPGRYHIEVTRPGYHRYLEWVEIGDEDTVHPVVLDEIARMASRQHERLKIAPAKPAPAMIGKTPKRPVLKSPPEAGESQHSGAPEVARVSEASRKPKSLDVKPDFRSSRTELSIDPYTGMELIYLQPGCFQMGSEDGQRDEKPKHKVCLTQGYELGKYEVTQAQWQKVMGKNPAYFKHCGGDCPVEQVNWHEVQEFIRRLNQHTGRQYRLPTEAEWEYAARAGSETGTYNGNLSVLGENHAPELDMIAWYGGNSGVDYPGGFDCSAWEEKQYNSSHCGTHPVGLKKPNRWGFYDMLGNVWEWVQDWYASDYYRTSETNDPKGPADATTSRVRRGGSWYLNAHVVRSAIRYDGVPDLRYSNLGFRLSRTR